MSSITQKVKDRKKPKRRGQPTGAKAGNYQSIIEKINHEDSKFAADCANGLSEMHRSIMNMALKKDEYDKIGIKDQWNAIKYCRELMDQFLDEHYEAAHAEAEAENEEGETKADIHKEEQKANGTTGGSNTLISLSFNKAEK